MKPRDPVLLHRPSMPAMIVSVKNDVYQILTWRGDVLPADRASLLPFPTVLGADPTCRVPDYNVEGVSEIVELLVDFDIEPPRRIKSPLYLIFSKLEQERPRS